MHSNRTRTCAVQSKIPCILKTMVREAPSTKRVGQNYCVEACHEISDSALLADLENAVATEKIDGTCCHIRKQNGKLMLWARLDRKPKKKSLMRFKAFQTKHREWQAMNQDSEPEPEFVWKIPDDLKEVPEQWIPADDVNVDEVTQCPVPDQNGHIPGWMPVENTNQQYCWHSSVVDYDLKIALTLRVPDFDDAATTLELGATPLSELEGKTLELVGTNINGNPYKLGDKKHPFHILVEHGGIPIKGLPQTSYGSIKEWFENREFSNVEGIVWHLQDGKMFKLHRHHMKLPWPLPDQERTSLSSSSVKIVAKIPASSQFHPKSMLSILVPYHGQVFDSLCDFSADLGKI